MRADTGIKTVNFLLAGNEAAKSTIHRYEADVESQPDTYQQTRHCISIG